MTEDEAYRASTQYRLWSFTPQALASLRSSTNTVATEQVRAAIKRARASRNDARPEVKSQDGSKNANGDGRDEAKESESDEKEIECLTVEEEQKLVGYYCSKAMDLADFCSFPTNVKATAVQYLKRFYLSNSPMTYHPKSIMPCALFLATKTENHYTSLKTFASKVPKTTPEDVIAAEMLIIQGLRFTLDVRHPFRALEGGIMELLALADGTGGLPPSRQGEADAVRQAFCEIRRRDGSTSPASTEDVKNRIREAHGKAKDMLKTGAQLTDAYFHYTPAHIWLASLLVADEPLALFFLDVKLGASPGPDTQPIKAKLTSTLHTLSALLQSASASMELAELKRIDKKLFECRNPEKMDLVGLNRAQKREGLADGLSETAMKKRRLERERGEREGSEVFGGELTKSSRSNS